MSVCVCMQIILHLHVRDDIIHKSCIKELLLKSYSYSNINLFPTLQSTSTQRNKVNSYVLSSCLGGSKVKGMGLVLL